MAEMERQTGRRRVAGVTAGAVLSRTHLADLPRRPGVYLMIDANDRVLYIGKAKSIRDRVSSYYSQPLGYTRKMDGLAEAIHRIDHKETGSELVALLLESQLIRRHQPPYNTMLRNSETYPYIRIDPGESLAVLATGQSPATGRCSLLSVRTVSVPWHVMRLTLLNRRFAFAHLLAGFQNARQATATHALSTISSGAPDHASAEQMQRVPSPSAEVAGVHARLGQPGASGGAGARN